MKVDDMNAQVLALRQRLQKKSVIAVTVESCRIAVDFLVDEGKGSRLTHSFVLPIGADAVIESPEEAGKQLAAQLEVAAIKERRTVVCVPANWALTTTAEVPEVGEDDLRGYMELRAEREFPISVTDLRLASCTYRLPDGKQRATLAAVPVKRMAAVEKMLAAAECKVMSISLGLDECVSPADQPSSLSFVANGNHVDLVIAAGGGIAAVRSLPAPAGEAAQTFDAAGFSREVRITLGQLPGEMRQELREASFRGTPATAENLCLEVRQHLRRMGIDSRLRTADTAHPAQQRAVAIASAERFLQGKSVTFEFVPPRVDRWQIWQRRLDDRRRRWLLVGLAGLLALPLITYIIRSHIESNLTAEWQGMSKKVSELDAVQQHIRQFRPWFEPVPRDLQVLENLAAAFPESGEVWAKSVALGENNKVTCNGFARNQGAWLAFHERLRNRKDISGLQVTNVRGENPIQFSIVYKWEVGDGK
jgi:Tfp pilus assembly protein PilN